jgi:hypothetical protein
VEGALGRASAGRPRRGGRDPTRARRRRARASLLEAALHPDPFYRANAVRWLGNAAAGVVDPVPEVRRAALEAAPRTPEGRAILLRLLEDVEPVLRARAAVEIFNRGGGHDLRRLPDLEIAVRFQRGWVEGASSAGCATAGDVEGAADAPRRRHAGPVARLRVAGLPPRSRAGRTAEAAGIRQTRAHALRTKCRALGVTRVSAADACLRASRSRPAVSSSTRCAHEASRAARAEAALVEEAAAPAGGPHR